MREHPFWDPVRGFKAEEPRLMTPSREDDLFATIETVKRTIAEHETLLNPLLIAIAALEHDIKEKAPPENDPLIQEWIKKRHKADELREKIESMEDTLEELQKEWLPPEKMN